MDLGEFAGAGLVGGDLAGLAAVPGEELLQVGFQEPDIAGAFNAGDGAGRYLKKLIEMPVNTLQKQ